MNQLTAQDIIDAYKKTGIHPAYDVWAHLNVIDGKEVKCGCGMTALILSRCDGMEKEEAFEGLIEDFETIGLQVVQDHLGKSFTPAFVRGFTNGFDNYTSLRNNVSLAELEEYDAGFKVGAEASKHLFGKELWKEEDL